MLLLREEEDLLARINEASDREYAIVFAHIRVEEDRIAPRVYHFRASRTCITRSDSVEHPCRGSNNCIGSHQPVKNRLAVPIQIPRRMSRLFMHGLRPSQQIPICDNDAWSVDRKIAITEMVEVKNIGA